MTRIRDIILSWLLKTAAPLVLQKAGLVTFEARFREFEQTEITIDSDREVLLRLAQEALDELHARGDIIKQAVTVLAAAERLLTDDRVRASGRLGDAVAISVAAMVKEHTPLSPPTSEATAC